MPFEGHTLEDERRFTVKCPSCGERTPGFPCSFCGAKRGEREEAV